MTVLTDWLNVSLFDCQKCNVMHIIWNFLLNASVFLIYPERCRLVNLLLVLFHWLRVNEFRQKYSIAVT